MQQCIKLYCSIFIWSSTCFGRHTAHHQKPKTALAASDFAYVKSCWTLRGRCLVGFFCMYFIWSLAILILKPSVLMSPRGWRLIVETCRRVPVCGWFVILYHSSRSWFRASSFIKLNKIQRDAQLFKIIKSLLPQSQYLRQFNILLVISIIQTELMKV
jgi:hypothetical protein